VLNIWVHCVFVVCSAEINSSIDGFWSTEGLNSEQEADEDISKIIQFLSRSLDKPPWEKIAMLSHEVKCLWN